MIGLIFNVLMWGLVIYWVLISFFNNSYRSEVQKAREFLAGIYEPMLQWIRGIIRPMLGEGGSSTDFAPLALLVCFWLAKRILQVIL